MIPTEVFDYITIASLAINVFVLWHLKKVDDDITTLYDGLHLVMTKQGLISKEDADEYRDL